MRTHIAALSLACMLLVPRLGMATEDGARDTFERAHAKILELVEQPDTKPVQLQREVDALLDYDWIATSALGGPTRYAERCADRCAEFEALLTALIRTNYLRHLDSHKHVSVEYVEEQVRETATKLDTRISFTDRSGATKVVEVDYVLHRLDGQWYVRDIITEDVSLAKTYKYEINKLYKDGGIDKVIATLQDKLDKLDATGS